MNMIRLILGGTVVLGLLAIAGIAAQGVGKATTATVAPVEIGAAVPAIVPASPTTIAPTATPAATIPPPPSPPTSDPPIASGTGQVGSAAIVPHTTPTGPGQPTFTDEDVRAHLATNGLDLLRVRTEGPYQIERITFLTYAEARAQFGIYVGVPEDRLLCLVVVRGTFKLTGPPVSGREPAVQTLTTMTLIFDGISGNRLGERGQP